MEENELHYHMKVRVFRKEGAFGPGVAELMRHVEETGSLSEACRCMGMAYSKGWRIMKHAEEDLGFTLMEGSRGGSRGGRTMLTGIRLQIWARKVQPSRVISAWYTCSISVSFRSVFRAKRLCQVLHEHTGCQEDQQ